MIYHIPVLLNEVIDALAVKKDGLYVDATIGGCGYTREILQRGGKVLGIDLDPDALDEAQKIDDEKITAVEGNFSDIQSIAHSHGFDSVDGVVFDLGVSSHQLDTPERGFSYRFDDSPLDMRFSKQGNICAADIVNQRNLEELEDIFTTYGEELRAHRIAQEMVRSRKNRKLETSKELLDVIGKATHGIDTNKTASRIYQALRIAVNGEMESLENGLKGAKSILKKGGILAVVSFHSLEDRIVKQCMDGSGWKLITKRPIVPSDEEQVHNKRSRSAKLRIAEKI